MATGTGKRKVVRIDGAEVAAKEGSVDYNVGGLSGEDELSTVGWAGMSRTPVAGMVKLEVIINGDEDESWWDPNIPRTIIVEQPDVPSAPGYTWTGMLCKVTKQSSGSTAALEFGGPAGIAL